ncbi:hypothetical protein BRPE64_DCDS10480 (plasmid) [Caballeronia insecticola]|uniref:Uncharacterized protein n=1 Tax=Caballeronia insecticola TaxID=758793 RepID=R4WTS0_9BURK|nr:hypothetical protein BRPE64_DCDS10480 [Caballeronia insecticola]
MAREAGRKKRVATLPPPAMCTMAGAPHSPPIPRENRIFKEPLL